MLRNLTNYIKQAGSSKGVFWCTETTALKKGHGMCFDLDYATTDTGETATDPFGKRGMKVVQKPSSTNNMAFAGVLTQDYPARPAGQIVELSLPGGCAMVAARFAATINGESLACHAGGADTGIWGLRGFSGRGSAIPLQTLTAAAGGDLAHTILTGVSTSSYSSSTGLTTITSVAGGTAVGYGDDDITATDFEVTVLGGADDTHGGDATDGELVTKGVYPVVEAVSANTFTISGDIGDCDVAITVTKKDLLILAYLEDGQESGLLEIVTPQDAVAVQSMIGGVTLACGGYTMAADSTAVLADGLVEGQLKGFGGLGTLTTKGYKVTFTSGVQEDHSTAIATCLVDAALETIVVQWAGNIGNATGGLWHELHNIGATIA